MALSDLTEKSAYSLNVAITNASTKNGVPIANLLKISVKLCDLAGNELAPLPSVFNSPNFVSYAAGETKTIQSSNVAVENVVSAGDFMNAKIVVEIKDSFGSPSVIKEEALIIRKYYPIVFGASAEISN